MPNRRKPADVIDKSDEHWHIDRKVPVATIVTLVTFLSVQTAGGIWWASKTDHRIDVLEDVQKVAAPTFSDQGTRLTRLETKVEAVQEGVIEIKAILRDLRRPMQNNAR